jgi:hypothetical protein
MKLLAILVLAAGVQAQSLGEIARKAREEKAGEKKATKVITNADLKAGTALEPAEKKAAEPAGSTVPRGENEKLWRARFSLLRTRLKMAEAQVTLLKSDLEKRMPQANLVIPYYYNPAVIQKYKDAIAAKEKEIDSLKQQIAGLEDELRRKNLPASWANP